MFFLKARVCGLVIHELRVTSYELQSTSYELQSTSYELQSTSYELQSTSYELQFPSYELQSTSYELQFRSYELQSTSYELQFRSYELQSTSYVLFHKLGFRNLKVDNIQNIRNYFYLLRWLYNLQHFNMVLCTVFNWIIITSGLAGLARGSLGQAFFGYFLL